MFLKQILIPSTHSSTSPSSVRSDGLFNNLIYSLKIDKLYAPACLLTNPMMVFLPSSSAVSEMTRTTVRGTPKSSQTCATAAPSISAQTTEGKLRKSAFFISVVAINKSPLAISPTINLGLAILFSNNLFLNALSSSKTYARLPSSSLDPDDEFRKMFCRSTEFQIDASAGEHPDC